MTRKYWINTEGAKKGMISLIEKQFNDVVEAQHRLYYKFKECNWFVYYLYKYTGVNLLAKDKLFWLKLKYLGA